MTNGYGSSPRWRRREGVLTNTLDSGRMTLMTNDDFFEEQGMTGDPRRCPRHPNVPTSSADGMFDAPCGSCEADMEGPC